MTLVSLDTRSFALALFHVRTVARLLVEARSSQLKARPLGSPDHDAVLVSRDDGC